MGFVASPDTGEDFDHDIPQVANQFVWIFFSFEFHDDFSYLVFFRIYEFLLNWIGFVMAVLPSTFAVEQDSLMKSEGSRKLIRTGQNCFI